METLHDTQTSKISNEWPNVNHYFSLLPTMLFGEVGPESKNQ